MALRSFRLSVTKLGSGVIRRIAVPKNLTYLRRPVRPVAYTLPILISPNSLSKALATVESEAEAPKKLQMRMIGWSRISLMM